MHNERLVKHLFISDLHIPDHNVDILPLIYTFISDFKPDYLHINGDFLNFTRISKYIPDPDYSISLADEIEIGRSILREIVNRVRSANPDTVIYFKEGNHEFRLQYYLAIHADQLAALTIQGQKVVSLRHLLNFDELNINWISYKDALQIGDVLIEHGDIVRAKSGYTANAMLDRRGMSVIIGHTHRLSYVSRSQFGRQQFAIEGGCLCNLNPTPRYAFHPDWSNGFVIAYQDKVSGTFYPELVPILNNSFIVTSKLYTL